MAEASVPLRRTIDDFEVAYLSAIVVVGVALNAALLSRLLTSSKQPTVRTSFSAGPYQLNSFALFKLNLCIADFCILLIYALGKIIWIITYDWRLGNVGCKAWQFFSAWSFYASANIIVNISLDRLKQVCTKRPQGGTSVRRVRYMLVVSWMLATLCSVPQLFVWGTFEVGEGWHQCVSIFQYHDYMNTSTPILENIAMYYELGHQATVFWIPFCITATTYAYIVIKLLMRKEAIKSTSVKITRPIDSDSRTDSSLMYQPKEKERPVWVNLSMRARNSIRWHSKTVKSRRGLDRESSAPGWRTQMRSRVFRCAMAVVLAHIAMWLPYNCISTLRFLDYNWYSKIISEAGGNFLEDLIIVNSLLNPLLYGRYQRNRGTVRYKP